jgi:hypothetical protein|tara:strand:+ start:479 stop:784 length:306 start_codon:yes stop_codon:yes gene_type:complete
MNRLDIIKQAAEKAKAKMSEAQQMKAMITQMDARKKEIKKEMKLHKKLTASVKKAGHQTVGSLDFNSPENMFYSEKDTARYLEGSSYMDSYNAHKADQEWN